MEKFNNTSIFTGYLKQLLSTYNLPKYKVYTREHQDYFDKYGKERADIIQTVTKTETGFPDNLHYVPYIRYGAIQEYIDDNWVTVGTRDDTDIFHTHDYTEGISILNYTKNLQIKNNVYDSYTHEYLGEYLRFQRDYNNINLMPLYNCFSNRACDTLDISFTRSAQNVITFNTNDTSSKIYMLPIKLFQKYTIAIDSELPVEFCCGMYGAYQDKRTRFENIPKFTYKKVTASKFGQPFLYTEFYTFCEENAADLTELSQNEDNLKLFIKLPQNNTSTIVVLEGDYTNWNDKIFTSNAKVHQNNTVINFQYFDKEKFNFPLKTSLQLLQFNTHYQIPFADRLIEYLVGNAITSADELQKNIMRVQKALMASTADNTVYKYKPKNTGLWDDDIKFIVYDYINNINLSNEVNHDILGYIDRDVEKYYSYFNKDKKSVSLSNTDIEDGEEI